MKHVDGSNDAYYYHPERERHLHIVYQSVIQKPVMAGDTCSGLITDSAATCSVYVWSCELLKPAHREERDGRVTEHLCYTVVRRVNCVLYPWDRSGYTSRHTS
jgi:hypothetical protein